VKNLGSEPWGEDGGDPHDEDQLGEDPGGIPFIEPVAHTGAGDDHPGGAAEPLKEPGEEKPFDRAGHRASESAEGEEATPGHERSAAAEPVGERSVKKLAEPHAEEKGSERDFHGFGLQIRLDLRKRGQVHVDGERPERGQRPQQDDDGKGEGRSGALRHGEGNCARTSPESRGNSGIFVRAGEFRNPGVRRSDPDDRERDPGVMPGPGDTNG